MDRKRTFFRFCKKCEDKFTPTGRFNFMCEDCHENKYKYICDKNRKKSKIKE